MSHGDKVTELAPGFSICASSGNSEFAAIADLDRNFFGVQFHPEVTHTVQGGKMLQNFLSKACGFGFGTWNMGNFCEAEIDKIRAMVGEDEYVLGGRRG